MRYLGVISILAIVSQSCGSNDLPSYITPCKRNDPKLAICWKQQLENLRLHLMNGIPELGIKQFDPWQSPAKIPTTQPTFTAEFDGGSYTGVKDFKVLNNSINLQNGDLSLKIGFDRLFYHGNVQLKGSLFGYSLDGSGKESRAIEGLTLTVTLAGEKVIMNGVEHIRFKNTDIEVGIAKCSSEIDGVLENPDDEKLFNEMISQQIESFYPLLKLILAKSIGNDISEAIQFVYDKYPLSVLHP